jgi:IS5 family transposase
MQPGKRRQLDLSDQLHAIFDRIECLKAVVRARVKHPFRVLKDPLGYTKRRYRGLMNNITQIATLLALSKPVHGTQGVATLPTGE